MAKRTREEINREVWAYRREREAQGWNVPFLYCAEIEKVMVMYDVSVDEARELIRSRNR